MVFAKFVRFCVSGCEKMLEAPRHHPPPRLFFPEKVVREAAAAAQILTLKRSRAAATLHFLRVLPLRVFQLFSF